MTDWEIIEDKNKKIKKEFKFGDFIEAISFVNKVAETAEKENHHPDIHIFYNRVVIELWTHSVGGVSEKDYNLAAKIDEIFKGLP
ncbi:MAG: 4a-hydroxytetrahydrobiopterin dehydratase [Patescibacteria group bacterium]